MEAVAREAAEPAKDPSISRGYSFPASLHDEIQVQAKKRQMSRSDFVRKAVRYYLRALKLREGDPVIDVE